MSRSSERLHLASLKKRFRHRFVRNRRETSSNYARSGRNASTNHRKALYPLFTDQQACERSVPMRWPPTEIRTQICDCFGAKFMLGRALR